MSGRRTPDVCVSTSRLSEFLHATLHAVGGANGQIHRIAGLLEGQCGNLDEAARSWLAHLTTATQQLDQRLQAVRRYTEIFDLPRTQSRFPLGDALSVARSSTSGECMLTVGDLPEIDADARRLQLVFKELLSNACKFHAAEVPEVGVSARNNGGWLVVSLDDNGIGIEPHQLERIFVPFVQLWGDRFQGAGMGLAIARDLVEGWGGRMWVESTPGAGSSFRFTLPYR
jgi:signal transduction histidine kinase